MPADFVAGDTGSVLQVTCKDPQGNVLDLTNYPNVSLRWLKTPATPGVPAVYANQPMTIENAAKGLVSYKFAAGELVAGKMRFEVEITDVLGGLVTSITVIEAQVRGHI